MEGVIRMDWENNLTEDVLYETANAVAALMESLMTTPQSAMDLLEVPEAQRGEILERLPRRAYWVA